MNTIFYAISLFLPLFINLLVKRVVIVIAFSSMNYASADTSGSISPQSQSNPAPTDFPDEDLFSIPMETLLDTPITASSFFDIHELETPMTVNKVSPSEWRSRNARRLLESVSYAPATVALPTVYETEDLMVRGYANFNTKGIAMIWDGVPMNDFLTGSALLFTPSINLATLNSVELVQGAGSSIYGSSAFHGILALQPFESLVDQTKISGNLSSQRYYEASGQFSGEARESSRVHLAVAVNGQGNQERTFQYEDPISGQDVSNERAHDYQAGTLSLQWSTSKQNPLYV